jgi:hypothetical protein
MSERNAKVLRRFARREDNVNLVMNTVALGRRLAALPHRDRGLVLGRIKTDRCMPVVRLSGGTRLDLRAFAVRRQPSWRPR